MAPTPYPPQESLANEKYLLILSSTLPRIKPLEKNKKPLQRKNAVKV
jgi:hypothetical protein